MTDDVEYEIHIAALRLQTAKTQAARRKALADLREWAAKRTPARIRQMEIEQGLATPAPTGNIMP